MKECDFIDWIRAQSAFDPSAVPVGPGDDMAVIACGSQRILLGVDQALDGVHFVLAEHGPHAAGRKVMARNLSDVAAMAAVPQAAVASVALPKGLDRSAAEAIYQGLRVVGDEFRCPVVGGDVGVWPGALAISVTLAARSAGVEPILRSGAVAGDAVCVTGSFGGAWKSQRHLTFTPRINEAIALAAHYDPRAMIDVSDGLAVDLTHVCEASGVGAVVVAADVPIHEDVRAPGDEAALAAALGDGEDYELLFTLPEPQAARLIRDQPLAVGVTRIGTIEPGSALELLDADGLRRLLKTTGWEHET